MPQELPWLSASKTRNYLRRDPILDWLDRFGADRGYVRDDQRPGYDVRTDFGAFLREKSLGFESELMRVLRERVDVVDAQLSPSMPVEEQVDRTRALLEHAPAVVSQACVSHGLTRTYGRPDLLVRSDILRTLWPDLLDEEESRESAPELGLSKLHYRVVDIKFTTLRLRRDGSVGGAPAYEGQLAVYSLGLGELQGFEPPTAYLLGRGWEQSVQGEKVRGRDALERLGSIHVHDDALQDAVDASLAWLRRLDAEGSSWSISSTPTVPELYPNMGNQEDAPWHAAKKEIAHGLEELTLLWQVGVEKREAAHAAGIRRIRDVRQASDVGVNGKVYGPVLDALLAANRPEGGELVQPAVIQAAVDEWSETPALEFYVDFETVSDLDDDFSQLPERGGQPLIFMVGCGHIEEGRWCFREFIVHELTEAEETRIIDDWLSHMAETQERRGGIEAPKVIHWSNAERSTLDVAYNSAAARRPGCRWPVLQWFDLLARVIRKEPVVIRGALGFGLKAIGNALHAHGLIETRWTDGPGDGLGAMVGAWRAASEARERGVSFSEVEPVRSIAAYNEVDCRVMWEVLTYLRRNHSPHIRTKAA